MAMWSSCMAFHHAIHRVHDCLDDPSVHNYLRNQSAINHQYVGAFRIRRDELFSPKVDSVYIG